MRNKNNKFVVYELTDPDDSELYLSIINNTDIEVLDTQFEFTKTGHFLAAVHFCDSFMQGVATRRPEVKFEMINMAFPEAAGRYEEIYNNFEVTKKNVTFNNKTNNFIVAIHYYEPDSDKRDTIYPIGDTDGTRLYSISSGLGPGDRQSKEEDRGGQEHNSTTDEPGSGRVIPVKKRISSTKKRNSRPQE